MPIRSQSMLGNSVVETRKDQNMGGTLLFGKVVKVYHKNHSADVEIMNNQFGKLLTSDKNEGKYACKILENYAGFDSNLNVAYGNITPIQVGDCVVVGFINNYKSQPVILGCLHSTDNSKSILPSEYPLNEGEELDRKLSVTKLQDYFTINGNGDWEIAHHSNAFVHASSNTDIDAENFDWEDLQLGSKIRNSSTAKPLSIIAGIKTFVGSLKLFIQGTSGLLRLFRTSENTLSLIESDKDGNFRLRLQSDSAKIDDGNTYSELSMNISTGDIRIIQKTAEDQNEVLIDRKSVV